MPSLRIVATAAELAAAVQEAPSDAPVYVGHDEIEPGSAPDAEWAVVVEHTHLPAGEHGGVARPGERIATGPAADDGGRPLLAIPVVTICSRRLATPGRTGPQARPADPCLRRPDTYDDAGRTGDLTLYLMELLEAVARLQQEVQAGVDDDHMMHPAARHRLAHAAVALQAAQQAIDDATRYGAACDLVRGWPPILDDAEEIPCDATHLDDAQVELPHLGYAEVGCPAHAAAAVRLIPGAHLLPPRPA
ncbi:hypothetical protein [Streptosporangium sp. NPDC051022]|uniref:hypothetical protein n=1 Tax=Streptosporangium sp. NPDC051022 TaxID=3155752 RepID=UPI0034466A04